MVKKYFNIDNIINYAKKGNINKIKEVLNNGFDINMQDKEGFTILLEAAEFGHKDLFWYLIEHNANLKIETKYGFSIIHAIALGGDLDMLKYALRNKVISDQIVKDGEQKGYTVIDYAKMSNNTDIIKYIKKRFKW